MKFYIILLTIILLGACNSPSVNDKDGENNLVQTNRNQPKKVKNIILMVGGGMGLTQVYAGMTANKGKLNLERCSYIGLSKTDSAAGATAFSAGKKTYNGAIGVDANKKPIKTILEMAEEAGLASGLVATCEITHATPASFIAHQPSRSMHEEIAADFLKTDIDVFIGGGRKYFAQRTDGQDLTEALKANGYQLVTERFSDRLGWAR